VSTRPTLDDALVLGKNAVELEENGPYELAIPAYTECIELLDRVLETLPRDGDSPQVDEARSATTLVSVVSSPDMDEMILSL
jgi:hypothetical protein